MIALMARLPGSGRARPGAVLAMIRRRAALLEPLSRALAEVAATARDCSLCGNIATGPLCPDLRRPGPRQWDLRGRDRRRSLGHGRGAGFRGRYHVLGGVLSRSTAWADALRIPAFWSAGCVPSRRARSFSRSTPRSTARPRPAISPTSSARPA